jgi:hypothetical protein
MVQLNGFFKAVYSINGNPPTPSCGYTENVRVALGLHRATIPDRGLIISCFYSGFREKCRLVRPSLTHSSLVKLISSI